MNFRTMLSQLTEQDAIQYFAAVDKKLFITQLLAKHGYNKGHEIVEHVFKSKLKQTLFDCLTLADQLTVDEAKDIEYVQDRIEVHIENCGFNVEDYDTAALAKELSKALVS